MGISTPKSAIASAGREDAWNRDYPSFVVEGDEAEALNESIEEGDWIAMFGRMDTRQRMAYEGNRMYREVWEPYIKVDSVLKHEGRIDSNNVILCGEVIRVYRNADEGKKFYMITLRTANEDGTTCRATVTYFDPQMKLEPKVGDTVFAIGKIQTKREESEDGDRRRTRFIVSAVTRNAVIERKE